ncbi:MAG TPA: phosphate ABC transporter substrate-binding protein PstS [Burkholderiales bacterium]|nr:phosphate ABC transporter substrate-binding protein PstS [Burkholderiales bacterium]
MFHARITLVLAAAGVFLSLGVQAADITGAGATFPYPIYAKWADAYKKDTGVGLNYQSIGSGGGIKQIRAKTVDFGASDMPLKAEELGKDGLLQFPAIIGGVVPVVNIEGSGPGQLKLSGKLLADIYLGQVTKWDDPAIANLNPGVKLPSSAITVVRRADGSGTTFLFTNYLSQVSSEWQRRVGAGTAVSWPVGIGGKGNEGVAAYVQRVKGSIGYVEYAYAKKNKMSFAVMQNRDGKWVSPNEQSFAAAAGNAEWDKAPGFYEILTDQPGAESWPITGASFILVYKAPDNPDRAREVLRFFSWAFKKGGAMASELDYVPMPHKVISLIERTWSGQIKTASGQAVWQ